MATAAVFPRATTAFAQRELQHEHSRAHHWIIGERRSDRKMERTFQNFAEKFVRTLAASGSGPGR